MLINISALLGNIYRILLSFLFLSFSYFCVHHFGELSSQFSPRIAFTSGGSLRAICTHLTALVYASWD